MRTLLSFFLLFLLGTHLFAQNFTKANVAFLADGIDGLQFKDGRIAIDLWFNILAKDVESELQIIYYDNIDQLMKDFKDHKFEYAAVNPYFYLKNSSSLRDSICEYWTIQRTQVKLDDFVVLTHVENNINTLEDLHKKILSAKKHNYMDIVYLDKELLKLKGKKTVDYLAEIKPVKSYSRAILDTFFKKNDAAIVPKYSFEVASELNPILRKKLKIIASSGNIFLPFISFFHKDTPQNMRDKFSKSVLGMHETEAGKNIFNLFKMEGIYKLDKSVVEQQQEYFDMYQKLLLENGYK